MTLLCPACFENRGLKRRLIEIRPNFDDGFCSYHRRFKGIPIEAVAALVDEVFRANYTFAGTDSLNDPDDPGAFVRRGASLTDTVQSLTGADDWDVVETLTHQLVEDDFYLPQRGEEPFYERDFLYERIIDDGGHGALWDQFCEAVTYEWRFTNPLVGERLGEIFKNIHLQQDVGRQPPVYVLGPDTKLTFMRARIVRDSELDEIAKDPHGQLGPAPRRLGKSNRMNPAGISAFYGAFDRDTCISELRPTVGAKVVYASFKPARELVLLDTTRFSAPPKELNLFARDHVRRLSQWRFMQRFMTEIARPISPDDEPFDYVATQVVAEYLNKVHEVYIGKTRRQIDGIIYRSAQRPQGVNIVLLGAAARVVQPAPVKKRPSFPGLTEYVRPTLSEPEGLVLIEDSVMLTTVMAADFPPGPSTPPSWWPRSPRRDEAGLIVTDEF